MEKKGKYIILRVGTEDLVAAEGKAIVSDPRVEAAYLDDAISEMHSKGYSLVGITATRGCRKDSQHLYHFIQQD